ncbi:hypothetical protein TI39_contig5856g00008 [Zymoseptoria brevis]|uniref:Uncharacterized protein n=1 Tax=Zymoseptoria brevis TaxID=1047168 RepID=A0A0F4G4W4_9PEZI|nr:hypothetical protein TI39_contig5856g00008 [Zymoseptoria brevis]
MSSQLNSPLSLLAENASANDDDSCTTASVTLFFFFNLQEIIRRILISDIRKHQGIGHFTDLSNELWESMAWTGSIRTTSGEFAHYPVVDESSESSSSDDNVNTAPSKVPKAPKVYSKAPA